MDIGFNTPDIPNMMIAGNIPPWMSRCMDPIENYGYFPMSCDRFQGCTLPKANIFAPKKWWFPTGISFSSGLFSGAMLVFMGVSFWKKPGDESMKLLGHHRVVTTQPAATLPFFVPLGQTQKTGC